MANKIAFAETKRNTTNHAMLNAFFSSRMSAMKKGAMVHHGASDEKSFPCVRYF